VPLAEEIGEGAVGASLWLQFLVKDPSASHGLTLSNGLRATAP
jgi:hypothetical protein